jgi:hypothetical protein
MIGNGPRSYDVVSRTIHFGLHGLGELSAKLICMSSLSGNLKSHESHRLAEWRTVCGLTGPIGPHHYLNKANITRGQGATWDLALLSDQAHGGHCSRSLWLAALSCRNGSALVFNA